MKLFHSFLLCVLSGILSSLAEITILKAQVPTLYDRSPKLRIRGAGFDADDHNIILELGAQGQPPLRVDKDYMITKDSDGDGLILKLMAAKKWVNLDGRTPPVSLILSSVKFSSDPNTNLLPEPVFVANVLPTPTVAENLDIIFTTATNELRINGTGFMGAKEVKLYFQPPLFKGIAYEDVSKYPLTKDQIVLRRRTQYPWREEPGPLAIIGIDTGAGPVKTNGDDGVRVAEVQADLDTHGVTVDTTAPDQLIYNDQSSIIIKGEGFNKLGNSLRFTNGILGKGINFTSTATDENTIVLKLTSGSHWRKNVENLPGLLTLLAVNAGDGFVAVGPANAGKGVAVATVFERPDVFSANTKIFRTHAHELHIKGAGFTKGLLGKTSLRFEPPLVEGDDYTINVIDRSELEVTLKEGHGWRQDIGPLLVTAINTRGDEAGWIAMKGEGVHVADVVEDIGAAVTGGVEIFPMGVKVYQSALQETIAITGTGFQEGMTIVFEPDLKQNIDYDMEVSKNRITLRLRSGKKWRTDPGFIIAKSVKIGGKSFPLAGMDGIRVAVVLADPTVKPGKDSFHETQSKVIAVTGKGFTNVADTKLIIRPTAPGAYRILAVMDDTIRVQLKQGFDWLPSFLSLKDEDENKRIPLQVTGIDTGAGEIVFDDPITVGYVVKDREGVVCDDSCEFAFDGVCDDGTEGEYYEYYENYGYYMDDDLGGYYSESYGEGASGYGYAYDDYYMPDDGYKVSACVEGTDCTDCGGVDAIIDYGTIATDPNSGVVACDNSCPYSRDGVCDDPRGANYCKLGTDCQDCGPVGADNFTRADDDGWWDDDDDYWTFNDGNFLDQTKGLEANRHRVKVFTKTDSAGPAAMFLVVLEGMVYTVGAVFASAALYLGMRWYNGQPVPWMNMFNPESNIHTDLEMAPTKRMPITPDVIRT